MDGDGFATPLAGRASMAGVYDASAPLDGLRFVRAMMEAGAAEEVLLRALRSDQRAEWIDLLQALAANDDELGEVWGRWWWAGEEKQG